MSEEDILEAAWQTVQLARHQDRPQTLDYIALALPDFLELSGDRLKGDDKAIVGGFATLGKQRIVLIGHQKGHSLKERQDRSFGMTRPEGYRKAMRLARLGEKFGLPVVTLVDTRWRLPGQGRGRGRPGGRNRAEHRDVRQPEGAHGHRGHRRRRLRGGFGPGSGRSGVHARELHLFGDLARGLRGSWSGATPTRRHGPRRPSAWLPRASSNSGLIDAVIPEPPGGAQTDQALTARRLMHEIQLALLELGRLDPAERLRLRREKYLKLGATSPRIPGRAARPPVPRAAWQDEVTRQWRPRLP